MTTKPFTKPLSKPQRMTYRIGRGETLVLTFEPYKSEILPLWRFKTPSIARKSSKDIWNKFLEYEQQDDFVGMDMSRKFLQMGMTRAKRYANHKGGRKYGKERDGEGAKVELEKCEMGVKEKEKLECSLIFREVWERAKSHGGYLRVKEAFQEEQKEWDKEQKKVKKEEGESMVKNEDGIEVKMEGKEDGATEEKRMKETKEKMKKEIKAEHTDD